MSRSLEGGVAQAGNEGPLTPEEVRIFASKEGLVSGTHWLGL